MPIAVAHTIHAIEMVVKDLPIGTNLALMHLLWTLLSGALLRSRAAIFPALLTRGFSVAEARRSWAALRGGVWRIGDLIQAWRVHVLSAGQWQEHVHGGYRPVAVDLTAFPRLAAGARWRPRLKGWLGKHFNSIAGRALPAVVLGVVTHVGQIELQRVPLLKSILRARGKQMREADLKVDLLRQLGHTLEPDEVAVLDAGFKLSGIQAANITRFVVRLAANCTARRNDLPEFKRRGRKPEYGVLIRPLPRKRKGHVLPATLPDFVTEFSVDGRTIHAKGWHEVVLANVKAGPQATTFDILVFEDPLYDKPLILGTLLRVLPKTILDLPSPGWTGYTDRWPVEQVPLSAKQMLGAHRQFVSAPECCQRFSELALLAGSMLTYQAAVLPALPTGFWDRQPRIA